MPDKDTFSGQHTGGGGELRPGTILGNYELREPIGKGGMGQVWKAWDIPGRREVAVKLLPAELKENAEAIALVRQSFQQVHALTHTHIGKVLVMQEDPLHGPYIVMDLAPGITLSAFATRSRQEGREFGPGQVARLLRPIAEALDYAHSRGVLHRDVKPQNMLVQLQPVFQITLIDFGLAAAIRTSLTRFTNSAVDTRGTRPYMSPEQFRGKSREWDGRTDQYSLAVVAFELLGGYLPFESADEVALMYAVVNEPADPIRGQGETVNAALLKALAKNREDRFSTCAEFIDALAGAPVEKPPKSAPEETPSPEESVQRKKRREENSLPAEALTPHQVELLHGLLKKLDFNQRGHRRWALTGAFQFLFVFLSIWIFVALLASTDNWSAADRRMAIVMMFLIIGSNAVYWTARTAWKNKARRQWEAQSKELVEKIRTVFPEVVNYWGGWPILEEPEAVRKILADWPGSCGLTGGSAPGGAAVSRSGTGSGAVSVNLPGWLTGFPAWLIGIGGAALILLIGWVFYLMLTA